MRISRIFIFSLVGILSACLKDNTTVDPSSVQYSNDTTAIAGYLTKNGIGAIKLPQGIWFIIDSATEGIRPTFYDSVKLKYTTRLLADNSIIGQSTIPKHFVLDSLIYGVQIAMPQFQAGSKGRIFIPTAYSMGYTNVAIQSNLIFEFQLIDVKDHQLKLDTTTIGAYLKAHTINAVKDASGLRYTMDTLKAGTKPLLSDEVQVNYTAKNLSDGSIVDQGTSLSFQLSTLILGWQIVLQEMPEGSTFTVYVPSSLAYGPNGNSSTIKTNANLIFTVKLLKVIHH